MSHIFLSEDSQVDYFDCEETSFFSDWEIIREHESPSAAVWSEADFAETFFFGNEEGEVVCENVTDASTVTTMECFEDFWPSLEFAGEILYEESWKPVFEEPMSVMPSEGSELDQAMDNLNISEELEINQAIDNLNISQLDRSCNFEEADHYHFVEDEYDAIGSELEDVQALVDQVDIESETLAGQFDIEYVSASSPAAQSVVERLTSFRITASNDATIKERTHCPICRELFIVCETARQLPCGHFYHEGCILPWLNSNNTCPDCRCELPTADAANEEATRRNS
eukprot:TRINITY_DN19636_c0_g1_i1.p1 TRINITY_DN19636_c0_g1~~TRINITY_DN19636_c0_g1_i1.p1  ORF type:complete len:284 (+),score=35.45 TRINITY_DN19636_c0_g1_i1:125-976(+)